MAAKMVNFNILLILWMTKFMCFVVLNEGESQWLVKEIYVS